MQQEEAVLPVFLHLKELLLFFTNCIYYILTVITNEYIL